MRHTDAAILHAVQRHGSQRKAAAALGIHSRTLERRMARMGDEVPGQRGLVIDVETEPLLVYTWGMYRFTNPDVDVVVLHCRVPLGCPGFRQ